MKHLKLFDEKEDAMSIQSNEEFCKDESFFSSSYLVKYSGIGFDTSQSKLEFNKNKEKNIT